MSEAAQDPSASLANPAWGNPLMMFKAAAAGSVAA